MPYNAGRSKLRLGAWPLLLCAVAVLLLVAACGDDDDTTAADAEPPEARGAGEPDGGDDEWAEVLAAADAEGSLVAYSAQSPETNEALTAAFEAAYPNISVEIQRLGSSDLIAAMDAEYENDADGADVAIASIVAWVDEKSELPDYFAELTGPDIADLGSTVLRPHNKAALTLATPFGIGSNTSELDAPISEYEDLLDPPLTGRIGTQDYSAANNTILLPYLYLRELYGEDFLEAFAEQDPQIFAGSSAAIQALASGETVADAFVPGVFVGGDLPIEVVYPDKPLAFPLYTVAAGKSDSPNAAQVFANFLLTEEGQNAVAEGAIAVLPDIESAVRSVDEATIIDEAEYTQEDFDELRGYLDTIFTG